MTNRSTIIALLAACGAATGAAIAQPVVITGTGATAQEAFFRSPASTNDFIDADGDGISGARGSFFPDQLAPQLGSGVGDAPNPDLIWMLHYRLNGSGNGIRELDFFGDVFNIPQLKSGVNIAGPDGQDTNGDGFINTNDPGNVIYTDGAIWNRFDLVLGAALQTIGDPGHLSGAPLLPKTGGSFQAGSLFLGDTVGFNVDFAAADVPMSWFAIQAGLSSPINAPAAPGYGDNPRLSTTKDASAVASQSNKLRPLNRLNTNTAAPDNGTVYSTAISLVPIGAPTNYGVGYEQFYMSDIRHLNATGRLLTGENLMAITRDSGSGTRNAFQNGVGLDPSWGRGENVGTKATASATDLIGPNFQPSHKGGSSRVDATAANHRLAVGHTGADRGVTKGRFASNHWDYAGIVADLKGGTIAARPSAVNITDGSANGYSIVGAASLSHLGDPRNASPAAGGWGWDPQGFFDGRGPDGILGTADDEMLGANPFAANPVPVNSAVSAYINNITRSITGFVAVPGGFETEFTPGEVLARDFTLAATPDNVSANPPASPTQPIAIVPNANQNAAVKTNFLSLSVFSDPLYNSWTPKNGRVPVRTALLTYSDGNTGEFYRAQNGTAFFYGDPNGLNARNKIAYDFNGNGVRDIADAADIVAAYIDRTGGAAWTPSDGDASACVELLGDGNGDGNFTIQDVRYWADGLVLTTAAGLDVLPVQGSDTNFDGSIDTFTIGDGVIESTLDRTAGFSALDTAFGGNLFGTTLVTGVYNTGDSRGDVAGPTTAVVRDAAGNTVSVVGATPGFAPQGADGTINISDINYVCANFGNWQNLSQAANIDLSCDMNGDLVVNALDVAVIVEGILDSQAGDVNLDGVRDAADAAIVTANMGMTNASYSNGDVNCDGIVSSADKFIVDGCTLADFNGDGILDNGDIGSFVAAFLASDLAADLNGDGILDNGDIGTFVALFLNCVG